MIVKEPQQPFSTFVIPQRLGILSKAMSDSFTYAVIGKAMEVHREIGPGVDEIFYHELISERLRAAGIEHVVRLREHLVHRGIVADTFEADLVFPHKLIVELKCLKGRFDPEHYVQTICYLKFWGIATGLLFDFAKDGLLHRRVNYVPPIAQLDFDSMICGARDFGVKRELAASICSGIGRIVASYGFGYRDTTYRGLLAAEFSAENLGCLAQPSGIVTINGFEMGTTKCDCLAVGGEFGVQILALRHSITAADMAILRTHLRILNLSHGLIVNFGKNTFDHRWVGRTSINSSHD